MLIKKCVHVNMVRVDVIKKKRKYNGKESNVYIKK